MNLYKAFIKPLLFLHSPETAHHFVFSSLKFILKIPGFSSLTRSIFTDKSKSLEREVFGIKFPNPVGLAAGFDKDAKLFNQLSSFGFGFIEVGTVTPKAQAGNPKPRMFRLPVDEALINRMGFNNEGVEKMVQRLRKNNSKVIIGGNIGKNKDTPNERAVEDYECCFRILFDVVDYFVVNVSSPNTVGLRELQEKEPLLRILNRLQQVNSELASTSIKNATPTSKPILLKISPDLETSALDEIIEVCTVSKIDGIIATNTTISRAGLLSENEVVKKCANGGLSGKPLRNRSTEVIKYISDRAQGKLVIIGVGGIHSASDAIEKINAGATLVQVYTGFIYEGPSLIKKINTALADQN